MKQFFGKIKRALSSVFSRKKNSDDYEDRYHDDEDDAEYLSDEDYEDYEEDDDFTPEEFTLSKEQKNELDGDLPSIPDAPKVDYEDDDSEDYAEEMLESTKPAFKEFKIPGQEGKLKQFFKKQKDKVNSIVGKKFKKKPSFSGSKLPRLNGLTDYLQNIDFYTLFSNVFSVESRSSIHKGFLVLTVGMGTYMTGKLIALQLQPELKTLKTRSGVSGSRERFASKLAQVKTSDLFQAIGTTPNVGAKPKKNQPKDSGLICEESSRRSSLPIKVVNTVVLQDSVKSMASVQVRGSKKAVFIREGEEIKGMAEIGKISRLKLIFKNLKSYQCEYVENKQKGIRKPLPKIFSPKVGREKIKKAKGNSEIVNVGNTFRIKKSIRDEAMSNMGELLTQARAIKIQNPDGSMCFKMVEVSPDSLYSKLNILNGDIICSVNGEKIRDLGKLMGLFGKLKDIDHFELSVKRNGDEQNMQYSFE